MATDPCLGLIVWVLGGQPSGSSIDKSWQERYEVTDSQPLYGTAT